MAKVFSEIGMSLDGFIAGPNAGPRNPLGDRGPEIHQWVYPLPAWRERAGLRSADTGDVFGIDAEIDTGADIDADTETRADAAVDSEMTARTAAGGGTGAAAARRKALEQDDALVRASLARIGAYVMGRRMFDEGELAWPEEAPFRVPVFVLTHQPRARWARPGGTIFDFVTTGLESALRQALAAAAGKDVRVAGGAETVRQFLRAGLLDELTIHLAPVLLGSGTRLFDQAGLERTRLEPIAVSDSPRVTHVTYRVIR